MISPDLFPSLFFSRASALFFTCSRATGLLEGEAWKREKEKWEERKKERDKNEEPRKKREIIISGWQGGRGGGGGEASKREKRGRNTRELSREISRGQKYDRFAAPEQEAMNQRGNVLSRGCFRNGTRVIPFSLEDSPSKPVALLRQIPSATYSRLSAKTNLFRVYAKNCENAPRELVADR